jgi:hypothetical protein
MRNVRNVALAMGIAVGLGIAAGRGRSAARIDMRIARAISAEVEANNQKVTELAFWRASRWSRIAPAAGAQAR